MATGFKARFYRSVTIDGKNSTETVEITSENPKGTSQTLAAAIAGVLSTRTDNDTGIITVASGHGITAADTVIVTWDAGGTRTYRYNVDVTAVSATTISIDVGAGTNLPIATTAVTVSIQKTEDCNLGAITLANLRALMIMGAAEFLIVIEVDGSVFYPYVVTASSPLQFVTGSTGPGRTAQAISDVLTGVTTTKIIQKLHLGNIATAANAVNAIIHHN